MKKGLCFVVLISFILILSSCKYEIIPSWEESTEFYPNGKPLDVQKLIKKRAKWKALCLENYAFTYEFSDRMNATGRYKKYKGFVIVKDGKGTLRFDKRSRIPSKNNPYEQRFFITSMEDVFDNILEDCFRLQKMKDEGKIDYLDVSYEWYDPDYFFLERIGYTSFRPSSAHGPRIMHFRILDFNVF